MGPNVAGFGLQVASPIERSDVPAALTMICRLVVAVTVPTLPVIVALYVPGTTLEEAMTVAMLVAPWPLRPIVTACGAKAIVIPGTLGTLPVRVT